MITNMTKEELAALATLKWDNSEPTQTPAAPKRTRNFKFRVIEFKSTPLTQEQLDALQALAEETWREGPVLLRCKEVSSDADG